MNEKEQIEAFADDVDRLVRRYENEFELSAASAVGVLQFKVHAICQSMMNEEPPSPEEEDNLP